VSQIIRTRSRNDSNAYNLLKVYSVLAAGGPFCDNREHYFKGYVHPPPNRRSLDTRDFVVRIEGHSMEPGIPSGSYCWLRSFVAGSRSGRTVLVEERKLAAYTLKRYVRDKSGRIFLRSDNPEQPDIEINEDGDSQEQRYAVIAEFVEVLEQPLDWAKSPWDSHEE